MPASNATLTTVGLLVALSVCLLSAYLVFRRHADRRIDYALACMTMLVASPMLEPVHMMVTLIPLMILFGTAFEQHDQQGSAITPKNGNAAWHARGRVAGLLGAICFVQRCGTDRLRSLRGPVLPAVGDASTSSGPAVFLSEVPRSGEWADRQSTPI